MFKSIRVKYRLSVKRFSTHSLRKSFAKRVYTMAGDRSEDALVRLSEMLGHSSTAITRRYIGLTQKVMMDTYDMLSQLKLSVPFVENTAWLTRQIS